MMNELKAFEPLAAAAAREKAPEIDVTDRVLERIGPRWESGPAEVPLAVFSAVSVLAASIALVMGLQAWYLLCDPLGSLFQPLTMVIQ